MVLDGESSALIPVTSGVPQGSILGPLPFIVMYRPVNSQSDVSSLQNDVNSILC